MTTLAQQAADFRERAFRFALYAHRSSSIPSDTWHAASWDARVWKRQVGYYNYKIKRRVAFGRGSVCRRPWMSACYEFQADRAGRIALLDAGLGLLVDGEPLDGDQKLNCVNFYAYLHKSWIQHRHGGDAGNPSLYNKTIVIRVSDHGEMGLRTAACARNIQRL
jgi:hypothetical protein